MNRETRSSRRVDAATRASARVARAARRRFFPRTGPAEKLDPISINGQLWLIYNNCKGRDGLFLGRAAERREGMKHGTTYCSAAGRPAWTRVSKVMQGAEPVVFTANFAQVTPQLHVVQLRVRVRVCMCVRSVCMCMCMYMCMCMRVRALCLHCRLPASRRSAALW